ncbi:hypothetical protein CH376_23080 [Leptospira adleri]|uniref:Uncharacterized protein n=1 Tax=Leptospira adleri TaxID=2023186 RepID=A0ABX4NUL1_9LEPT|nr:hypothetical protein CH376_23080 [Leptospira adleri]
MEFAFAGERRLTTVFRFVRDLLMQTLTPGQATSLRSRSYIVKVMYFSKKRFASLRDQRRRKTYIVRRTVAKSLTHENYTMVPIAGKENWKGKIELEI